MSAAIGGAATVSATDNQQSAAVGKSSKFADLSSTEFIKVLVQELTHQDPFKPNDSSKILEQLSSLRNIESQGQLQDQLKNLVLQNQVAQASGLIGKMVQGLTDTGDRLDGMVTSVRVKEGQAILELDTGKQLPMSRVERITEQNQAEPAA